MHWRRAVKSLLFCFAILAVLLLAAVFLPTLWDADPAVLVVAAVAFLVVIAGLAGYASGGAHYIKYPLLLLFGFAVGICALWVMELPGAFPRMFVVLVFLFLFTAPVWGRNL